MGFEAGQFQKFRVTTRVHLGAIQKDIYEDDIIEFDGHTLKYGQETYSIPILRAGIQAGWLVPAADKTSSYKAKSAGIKLHPIDASKVSKDAEPESASNSVSEDEAVVGSLDKSNKDRKQKDTPTRSRQSREEEPKAKVKVASEELYEPAYQETDRSVEEADEINHKRIKEIRAALEKKAAKKHSAEASAEVSIGSSGTPTSAESEGVVVKTYTFSDKASGVAVGATDSTASRTVAVDITKTSVSAIEAKQKPIGKRASSTQIPAEGNTDIRKIHKSGATGDAARTTVGDELSDLLPEAAVVGAAKKSKVKGFQWDMDRHWKTRVKDALDNYTSNPMLLRQIMAMEVPSVKERIQRAIGDTE